MKIRCPRCDQLLEESDNVEIRTIWINEQPEGYFAEYYCEKCQLWIIEHEDVRGWG